MNIILSKQTTMSPILLDQWAILIAQYRGVSLTVVDEKGPRGEDALVV